MTSGRQFLAIVGCGAACLLGTAATAQTNTPIPASQIPDLVVPTNGINLGSTSFYDGFSNLNPGVTLLQYVRYSDFDSITDSKGNESAAFQQPQINVVTSITQLSVATPLAIGGNRIGFDVLVPVTRIDSRFGAGGLQLRDNGTAIGDVTFGPFIQFKPVMRGPRPIASVRLAVNVIAPTGGFDRSRDLNQGSGYWSVNAYAAWTLLPAPGWEVSGRTQYLYNARTSKIANAPDIPGFVFRNGQAGQLAYSNFTVSREVQRGVAVGLNGFVVQQLDNDRINGIRLPDTKRSALYMGPGLHLDRLPGWGMNANLLLPVSTRNYSNGPQLNLQFILPLR